MTFFFFFGLVFADKSKNTLFLRWFSWNNNFVKLVLLTKYCLFLMCYLGGKKEAFLNIVLQTTVACLFLLFNFYNGKVYNLIYPLLL